ncbi:Pathogen-related protein [Paramyrothecium foliicola]|nr:Pathogen-related protein [Paramyrothecium foliicola]
MATAEADKAPTAVTDPSPAPEPEAPGLPDYMTDPDAVLRDLECQWRYGRPPDYSKTRQVFEESKRTNHEKGSLPDLVQNLVKNWEIEASYKTNLSEWRTVDPNNYSFAVNGGPPQTGQHMLKVGTYNAIITASNKWYSPKHSDLASSHKTFKRMMPTFAWEVLEVYSGPPVVAFRWRHWGTMKGDYSALDDDGEKINAKAHGGPIDIEGVTVAHLNDKMKVTKLETWFDPVEMFRQIAPDGPIKKDLAAAAAAAGCPVLSHTAAIDSETLEKKVEGLNFLKGLSHVLQDLEDVLSTEELTARRDQELRESLAACHNILHEVDGFVGKHSCLEAPQTSFRGKTKRIWRGVRWDPQEVDELRSRITAHVSRLTLFTSSINSGILFEVRNTVRDISSQHSEDQKSAFLDWISVEDFALQQLDFLERRHEGTGRWLLESTEFRNWTQGLNKTLFCPGIPGGGKTILASTVINHLQTTVGDDDRVAVAFLFCNFRRKAEQSARDLLSSLLRQLVAQREDLPPGLLKVQLQCKQKKRHTTFQEIVNGLQETASYFSRCFLVVDALDESKVSSDGRDRFLDEIFRLQQLSSINLFATSRHIPDIEARFSNVPKIEIRGHSDDIRAFLASSLHGFRTFVSRNPSLETEILEEISKAVDGMFLLADLYMQSLKEKMTAKEIRSTLKALPRLKEGTSTSRDQAITPKARAAYDQAYDTCMERILSQHPDSRDWAAKILGWISRAKRPLETVELQQALALDLSDGGNDTEEDSMPAIEDIVSVCAGLVIVDEQSNIIRLVHYTTQEFFDRTWQKWFPTAEENISNICLGYIQSHRDDVRLDIFALVSNGSLRSRVEMFAKYITQNWGYHCRACSLDGSSTILDMLSDWDEAMIFSRATSIAAYFGLVKTIQRLATSGVLLEPYDSQDPGPLYCAVQQRNHATLRLLLELGAKPDSTMRGRTPFYLAAMEGDAVAMSILVEHGANPNWRADSRTVLERVLFDGSYATANLLREIKEVDFNIASRDGETAIFAASM